MSNALAIATVTQTLMNRVTGSIPASLVNGTEIKNLRPDDSSLQGAETTPCVNVFLYQVTPNATFRNADLPTRGADGTTLLRRPQLALDLHYLFTFYGVDSSFDSQRLLGAVARDLHANPTLSRAEVQTAQTMQNLDSELTDQSELVRITPSNFSLDDISKLWAAFPTVDFVLSLGYLASVVLIETDDLPPAPALPVLRRKVTAIASGPSSITEVNPQSLALSTAPPAIITLIGQNLGSNDTAVFTTPRNTQPISAPFNSANGTVVLPTALRAGVNLVQLTGPVLVPPLPPQVSPFVSESNSMAFMLLPTIVNPPTISAAGSISVTVFPAVGSTQDASLIMNLQGAQGTCTLPADPHPTDTTTLTFSTDFINPPGSTTTTKVPSGTYLLRLQVDSANSLLTVDASKKFNGPTVTIP